MDDLVQKVKTILGIEDTVQDDVLTLIVELINGRLAQKLGQKKVPAELQYIVIEASVSRFNRISDEGKKSSGENDVSATWQTDDLAPFASDIDKWIEDNKDDTQEGIVRFV